MRFARIKCREWRTIGARRERCASGKTKSDAVNLFAATERGENFCRSLCVVRGYLQGPGWRQACAVREDPVHDAVSIDMRVAPLDGAAARVEQNPTRGFRSVVETDQIAGHSFAPRRYPSLSAS